MSLNDTIPWRLFPLVAATFNFLAVGLFAFLANLVCVNISWTSEFRALHRADVRSIRDLPPIAMTWWALRIRKFWRLPKRLRWRVLERVVVSLILSPLALLASSLPGLVAFWIPLIAGDFMPSARMAVLTPAVRPYALVIPPAAFLAYGLPCLWYMLLPNREHRRFPRNMISTLGYPRRVVIDFSLDLYAYHSILEDLLRCCHRVNSAATSSCAHRRVSARCAAGDALDTSSWNRYGLPDGKAPGASSEICASRSGPKIPN